MKSEPSASKSKSSLSVRVLRTSLAGLLALAGLAALASGCLDRPVVPAEPSTQNIFVSSIQEQAVTQIDLLFMIDNSSSMADKQKILAQAVPQLLTRLITPDCLDANGNVVGTADAQGNCPTGDKPEFHAVRDIHIGIVDSSLGGRGGQICATNAPPNDDMGQLIPSVRSNVTSYNNEGFLAWDPDSKDKPPGETNQTTLISDFTNMVTATNQNGCGFESQLEGWYRFLVDPNPPTHLGLVNGATAPVGGVDQTVLKQRAAFLRPNSLVAIVMLSDENDCSMIDHSQAYLVGDTSSHLPRATSACNTNPNSKCCFSCGVTGGVPSGCTPPSQDSNCQKGAYSATEDAINLRCFEQQRRFGISFLFPTQRYVNALTQVQICPNHDDLTCGSGDTPVANPLFNTMVNGKATPTRSPSLVFLAGIVGVPWQDIATANSLTTSHLQYLTADQLAQGDSTHLGGKTRWDLILGNPQASPPVPPLDPFMHEQIAARSGTNPITGDQIESSTSPTWNKINGHEDDVTDGSDLQYACIFKLPQTRNCASNPNDCDCYAGNPIKNSPLCESGPGGTPGTTQYYAKGYPGVRELEVLKGIGTNAIVGSICPKNICSGAGDPNCANPDYGYNPAVNAIIDRLKVALNGECLPRQLSVTKDPTTGKVTVPCKVVEAMPTADDCSQQGRSPLTSSSTDTKVRAAVLNRLKLDGVCTSSGPSACSNFKLCYIDPTQQQALQDCLNNDPVASTTFGYCYIDPSENIGSAKLVASCPPTEQRLLRLVSGNPNNDPIPRAGAEVFVACSGKTFSTQ